MIRNSNQFLVSSEIHHIDTRKHTNFHQPSVNLTKYQKEVYCLHVKLFNTLRTGPAAACLLRSWVRIPPGAWIFVCCECRVLSGRGLCDELITRPEESYRLWCVVCDLETSRICAPYIYDISSLRVNDLTLILLT